MPGCKGESRVSSKGITDQFLHRRNSDPQPIKILACAQGFGIASGDSIPRILEEMRNEKVANQLSLQEKRSPCFVTLRCEHDDDFQSAQLFSRVEEVLGPAAKGQLTVLMSRLLHCLFPEAYKWFTLHLIL